jgi:glycerol uptake facilitator-like aquaporin
LFFTYLHARSCAHARSRRALARAEVFTRAHAGLWELSATWGIGAAAGTLVAARISGARLDPAAPVNDSYSSSSRGAQPTILPLRAGVVSSRVLSRGAHLNPAITFALAASGSLPLARVPHYIAGQARRRRAFRFRCWFWLCFVSFAPGRWAASTSG